jgi:hypothetical protein
MRARARFGPALFAVASLVLALSAGNAWAAGIESIPALTLHITSDQGVDRLLDAEEMGCDGGSGYGGFAGACAGYNYYLEDGAGNSVANLDRLDVSFVVDPEVILNLSLTNTSANPQTFTLETTLPTGFFGPSNRMGGSVGGSITDSNGNGATVTSAALYSALIDGTSVQTLHAPLNLSAGNFLTVNITGADFGSPIPSAPAPTVNSDIGIKLNFRLSPGDQIALTSVFVVQTPEPAIGALLGGAGLLLALLRRRI